MKFKRYCFILLVLPIFSVRVYAAALPVPPEISADPILQALPEEARDLLLTGGLTPDKIDSDGLQNFLFSLADRFSESVSKPFRSGLLLLAAVFLLRAVQEISPQGLSAVPTLCGGVLAGTVFLLPVTMLIGTADNILKALNGLLAASVPVYASILAFSGNTLTGTTYGTLTLFSGGLITVLCRNILLPLTRIFLALSAASSVSGFHIKGWADLLYRLAKWLLLFAVTVFTGILSLQTVLSAQSDVAAGKAVKMIASGTIPFVGGAFGDAFSLLSASAGLLKSGIGAFGLLAVLAVFLPPAFSMAAWMFTALCGAFAADLFGLSGMADLLKSCAAAIKLLLAVLFSSAFSGLIAAGILLCVRSAYG